MSEEITKKSDKKTDKPWLFKPGQSGNPEGRPKGKKNYETEMEEAIKEYAKLNNKTPEQVKLMIYMRGASDALKGEYNFYRDFMDRVHGKPLQRIGNPDGSNIKPIMFLPLELMTKNEIKSVDASPEDNSVGQPPI